MQHHVVAYRDIISDRQLITAWCIFAIMRYMQETTVLYIAARTDADRMDISAY